MTILDDLRRARRVLLAHAHPDDETLSTGALALDLGDHGVDVCALTATRGERGEEVPGARPSGTASLEDHRAGELALALERLGVRDHAHLGEPPAAAGPARRYRDSGMRWVREGLAGPDEAAGDDAFSRVPLADAVADLGALLADWRPDAVVTYTADGGYGHPDHVRMHEVAREACARTGTRLVAITDDRDQATEWHDLPGLRERLLGALDAHRSQLSLRGDRIVHVGGQEQEVETWFGLAEVARA